MINNLKNVELINAGLGSENGLFPLRVLDEKGRALGGAGHFVDAESENNSQFIKVKTVGQATLSPQIGTYQFSTWMLKGLKKTALIGAMATIEKNRPILIIENLPMQSGYLINIFRLGYKIVGNVWKNTILSVR